EDDIGRRLLLIGTYRTEVVEQADNLAKIAGHLLRQRRATELVLTSLVPAEHRRLVEAALGNSADADLLRSIYARSDGNPFVTEELLGAMVAAGHLVRQEERWVQRGEMGLHLPLSLRAAVSD